MTKLDTKKRPLFLHVQTMERLEEIEAICEENGFIYTIGLEPEKPENLSELNRLLNPPETRKHENKIGRNEPCPCGSGKKYKKCCGK